MQVVHTLCEPPRYGNTILAHIGWRTNSDAELTATVKTKIALVIHGRFDTSRRFQRLPLAGREIGNWESAAELEAPYRFILDILNKPTCLSLE
jgi:hypothetical protein